MKAFWQSFIFLKCSQEYAYLPLQELGESLFFFNFVFGLRYCRFKAYAFGFLGFMLTLMQIINKFPVLLSRQMQFSPHGNYRNDILYEVKVLVLVNLLLIQDQFRLQQYLIPSITRWVTICFYCSEPSEKNSKSTERGKLFRRKSATSSEEKTLLQVKIPASSFEVNEVKELFALIIQLTASIFHVVFTL